MRSMVKSRGSNSVGIWWSGKTLLVSLSGARNTLGESAEIWNMWLCWWGRRGRPAGLWIRIVMELVWLQS